MGKSKFSNKQIFVIMTAEFMCNMISVLHYIAIAMHIIRNEMR